ncbi:MAG: hypothetical protein AB7N71_07080, partial [Phycisphaerae bacterium]
MNRQHLAFFAVGSLLAPLLHAQPEQRSTSLLQQQRLIDDKLALERQQLAPVDSILDWQWGGWLEYYYFNFDDGIQSTRELQRGGVAVWSRLTLDEGAHEFFVRVRHHYDFFDRGDEYLRQQDWVGPRFDRAWYKIDFRRAFDWGSPSDPLQI